MPSDTPPADADLTVVVAACRAADVETIRLVLPTGATVADALGALEVRHPGWWRTTPLLVGLDGRRATADEPLAPGARLELYRPLISDPKDARRRRAAHRANQSPWGPPAPDARSGA